MRPIHISGLSLLALSQSSFAIIEGLNSDDGYIVGTSGPTGAIYTDVNTYNAGQYGTSNGGPGGSSTSITVNSGLWKNIGGTSANIEIGQASSSHEGDGHLRFIGGGAINVDHLFSYDLDSRDLDGLAPSSIGGAGQVCLTFQVCPSKSGWSDSLAWLSFYDDDGTEGFSFGVDTTVAVYKSGGAASYTNTTNTLDWKGWNEVHLTFDFDTDLVSMDVTPKGSLITSSYNTALPSGFDDISQMQFGIRNNSAPTFPGADWSTYDDFNFEVHSVPEPSSTFLSLLGVGALFLRRRR